MKSKIKLIFCLIYKSVEANTVEANSTCASDDWVDSEQTCSCGPRNPQNAGAGGRVKNFAGAGGRVEKSAVAVGRVQRF